MLARRPWAGTGQAAKQHQQAEDPLAHRIPIPCLSFHEFTRYRKTGALPDRVSIYRAPAAAQGFDQRDAGSQLPAAYAQGRALITERSGLRHDDAQIAHDPGLVLIECDRLGFIRCLGGFILHRYFVCEHAQRDEVVFRILERGENCLPIDGNAAIVVRDCLIRERAARTPVEERLGQ
jgi:hypothetical protein